MMIERVLRCLPTLLVVAACATPGNVFSLEVGTCFNEPSGFGDEEIQDVEIVDCDTPHDMEVFHLTGHPGDEYPGDEAMSEFAADACLAAFEPYVGRAYETSALDIGWLSPSADSWEQGDREVVCTVFRVDGEPLMGSTADSGI